MPLSCTPPPPQVEAAFAAFPAPVQSQLRAVRQRIFAIAAETEGVGPLTETLKWGQPAYLTEKTRSGSTIRLGTSTQDPETANVFFICHTRLVEEFRTLFPEHSCFVSNRAIRLEPNAALPEPLLTVCLTRALGYHKTRAASG